MNQSLRRSSTALATIAMLPLVTVGIATAQGHALHHPQSAVIALTLPDVQAAATAWDESPLLRLYQDEELLALIEVLVGDAEEKAAEVVARLSWQRYLEGAKSFSLSVTPTSAGGNDGSLVGLFRAVAEGSDGAGPWGGIAALGQVQFVVDFEDAQAATAWSAQVHRLMESLALESLPEPLEPTRAELIGFTEEASSFARYAHVDGVDTVGIASRITVGSRIVVRIGGDIIELGSGTAEGTNADGAGLGPWSNAAALNRGTDKGPLLLDLFVSEGASDAVSQEVKEFAVSAPLLELLAGMLDPLTSILKEGGRWHVYFNGGDYVFQGAMPTPSRKHAAVFGALPMVDGALSLVHPDAQVAYVASLDAAAMGHWMQHAAELADAVEFLAEYGIVPLEVVPATFGSTVALELRPLKGLLTMPDLYLTMTLKDPAGIERLGEAGERMVGEFGPEGAAVLRSQYRGATLYSFRLPPDAGIMASAVGFQPTVVVTGDLAMMTLSIAGAKRWIREQGKERPVHAGLLSAGAPKGASSVSSSDWAAVLDSAYGHAMNFAPLLDRVLGANPGLDVASIKAALPRPGIFARYFKPGFSWTQPMASGGTYYAAESPAGYAGLAVLVGVGSTLIAPRMFNRLDEAQTSLTRANIMLASHTVGDYMLDRGEMPKDLEAVRAFSPSSFSGSSSTLEDAWGRPLRYRVDEDFEYLVWSVGPNGVNEDGEGDDITSR